MFWWGCGWAGSKIGGEGATSTLNFSLVLLGNILLPKVPACIHCALTLGVTCAHILLVFPDAGTLGGSTEGQWQSFSFVAESAQRSLRAKLYRSAKWGLMVRIQLTALQLSSLSHWKPELCISTGQIILLSRYQAFRTHSKICLKQGQDNIVSTSSQREGGKGWSGVKALWETKFKIRNGRPCKWGLIYASLHDKESAPVLTESWSLSFRAAAPAEVVGFSAVSAHRAPRCTSLLQKPCLEHQHHGWLIANKCQEGCSGCRAMAFCSLQPSCVVSLEGRSFSSIGRNPSCQPLLSVWIPAEIWENQCSLTTGKFFSSSWNWDPNVSLNNRCRLT